MTAASEPSPPTGRVLVVDDHAQARESTADVLRHAGHEAICCSSAIEALRRIEQTHFDVIITDLQMPGMNGLELIRSLQQRQVDAQVVMVTAYASVGSAVEAMRHGAFDYIEKPFNADQLEQLVARALRHGAVVGRRSTMPAAAEGSAASMIGSSPAMQLLRDRIAQVAPTSETVLISGESGTGKELVASSIHAASRRSAGALVGVNCPALSPQLMESELFGHEKGAFTSADAPRVGRFELADQGTLLLDEVTEIDLHLQAKLLRVLQEKCFERVGSSQTRRVDVRVIATTNRQLRGEVAAGRFREDLYFRLAVVPIHVPPLRERSEDVPALIAHFATLAAERLNKPPCELDEDARHLLLHYHWPGNVRELENIITRVSVLSRDREITSDQVRPWLIEGAQDAGQVMAGSSTVAAGTSLQEMERRLIEATLEEFGGHREKAAQALGIGVRTLANKLRLYGYAPRTRAFAKGAA